MKVCVCGGRDVSLNDKQFKALLYYKRQLPITEVVNGMCPTGVDKDAKDWAERNKLPVREFPANWERYGNAAGPLRNDDMAKYSDVVIAFPGGSGTTSMVEKARKYKKPVIDLRTMP